MERLARAATARMRSWTDSARVAVGTEWTTTSASGRNALDDLGGGHGDLFGALEGEVAGHGEGEVGEVAGAGSTGAEAIDREDAVDAGEVRG